MLLDLHPQFLSQPKGRRYLLGVSGGRDSVALLHALLDHGYRELTLCHLNHGLRGDESDADATFTQALATSLGLPCCIERVDVGKSMLDSGESMELVARRCRHQFFARCAQQYQIADLLLAHHADDQAETLLFNLLRGSGGLRGMAFSSDHPIDGTTLTIMRPLLKVSRQTINRYLKTHDHTYREDTSNAEPIATRNRIRNEAIPLLSEIMHREIGTSLCRAYEIAATKEDALQEALAAHQLLDPQGRLFTPKLTALPSALQLMALHNYLKSHDVPNISQALLLQCQQLLDPKQPAKINLPGGRFLRRKERRLFLVS